MIWLTGLLFVSPLTQKVFAFFLYEELGGNLEAICIGKLLSINGENEFNSIFTVGTILSTIPL